MRSGVIELNIKCIKNVHYLKFDFVDIVNVKNDTFNYTIMRKNE